jgi:WD40 repeat protein
MSKRYLPLMLLFVAGILGAEPARDRFGDPLPEGAIARLGNLPLRHEGAIQSAAFTADGKTLVTCEPLFISFWDPKTGECMRTRPLDRSVAMSIRRLSDDAKVLMLGDSKNVLHFIDPASGAEQHRLDHSQCGPIWGWPYLSRDGKILAAIHRTPAAIRQTSIAVWDVESGKLLHEFKEPSLAQVAPHGLIALTPDGKQLVLPHADGSLHLVDVASGKEVRAFEMPPPSPGFRPSLRFPSFVLSPDGRFLVLGDSGYPLCVCELATGKLLHQLRPSQGSKGRLAFTANGRFLAESAFNEIRLFGVLSGKEIRKLPKKPPATSPILAFSPDGRTLAEFPSGPTIHLWDMDAQRRLHPPVGHEAAIKSLAFFPDGKRLVSADQTGEMRVWDISSAQSLAERTYNYGAACLTVDKDGETVRYAGNDSSTHEWDLRTGREEVRPRVVDKLPATYLALSPDGRSLAVLVPNRAAPQKAWDAPELRLYDLKTNKSIVLPRPTEQGGFGYLTFTPDNRCLAASHTDGVLRLWDRDTGKRVREVPRMSLDGPPVHLAFAADGRSLLALTGEQEAVPLGRGRPIVRRVSKLRIREIASGEDRLQLPPLGNMFSLAYSPGARFIALGGWDGQIFVYSAVSGKQLALWQGNQGYVFALAFSRDARLLASGGANGTILIWKVPQDDSVPVVRKSEEAESLWLALGDTDAAVANRALAGLAADPTKTLPYFKDRLSSLGKELDRKQFAEWIAKLDDDSFKVREQATRELALTGADAADALRLALQNSPSAEAKRRIEDLLARLKRGGDSQRLRFLRAVEALERIGTPQAKDVLRSLAGQSLPPDLREEVQTSLQRLAEIRP